MEQRQHWRAWRVCVLIVIQFQHSIQCPGEIEHVKAIYKSGEMADQAALPITLERIKLKLRDSGIFDFHDPSLNEREKKELNKLFDAVEIMTTSRARQPSNAQNMFSSMRIVERAVKKQLKEGQISEALAAKFNWDKLNNKGDATPSITISPES